MRSKAPGRRSRIFGAGPPAMNSSTRADMLVDSLQPLLEEGVEQRLFSGASAAVTVDGQPMVMNVGTLAYEDPTAVTDTTLFDLASLTKTVTATVIVRLIERGVIDPDAPVREVLPVGTGEGADRITMRMLLTHTSGLPAAASDWRTVPHPPPGERLPGVLRTPLETLPDAVFRYSCVGFIGAAAVAEAATGTPLADLVRDEVSQPLGLESLAFGPVDPAITAATEERMADGRGVVRGEVHDELNWYLGGRAGNAGLFGNAADVAKFAQSFLDRSLLTSAGHRLMTTQQIRPEHQAEHGHGFGLRIDDRGFMGDIGGYGHTGFTGTSWMVDPVRRTAAALLTNRVHPRREHVDIQPFRRRFAAQLAAVVTPRDEAAHG
ncbi:serine hydrolase domain-containing protein [Agromyces archimandritae]|uniref:Beta-lactamase family protein n=1 Tax=Agromyces archimandritae TaxID=2781962 RepID=A0A975IN02_9MICO|nr:serine hydrolase domain-containing protein [Agromyces archimandritae]QTX04087.1 beta-lactamase family protein [Agromyces archimandritae]